MVELTDDVLYGDIWDRSQLSNRDRSLVTVSPLEAMNRPDQHRSHLALVRRNGVTEKELVEAITHLAFYSGSPNAVTALAVAKAAIPYPLTVLALIQREGHAHAMLQISKLSGWMQHIT